MSRHEPPYSDYRSLVTIAARAPAREAAPYRPLVARQLARRDAADRLGEEFLTLSFISIALTCVGAWWATLQYQAGNRHFQLTASPGTPVAVAMQNVTPASRVTPRGDVPQTGFVSTPVSSRAVQATVPLGWNDLTLMLRTGLSDDEVIAAAGGKQLTAAIGPWQESELRGMGAGNRLIGYLRGQRVYLAPQMADQPTSASARPNIAPQTVYAPAATPWPTIDYAARDREIARLKKKIDDLDEQIRITRTHPNDYNNQWKYRADGTRTFPFNDDAYLKSLEEQRDNLRREKWRLEGR